MTRTLSALVLSLSLAGCLLNETVTPRAIQHAQSLCRENGGLKVISEASVSPEYQGCGYKCSRETGRASYTTVFSCNDGTKFKTSFADSSP